MNAEKATNLVTAFFSRYPYVIAAFLGVAACVSFNLLLGQDVNYDARNYHVADVFRLLHGRENVDLIPQVQTWLNPVVYIPSYWLISTLSPVIASSVLAFVQGLNGVLIFALWNMAYRSVVPPANLATVAMAGVLVAVTGAMFLSEAGTTFADGLLSLPLIGALVLLIRATDSGTGNKTANGLIVVAGLLAGTAVGLKLTNAVFGFGFIAFIVATGFSWRRNVVLLAVFGSGAVFGILVTAAWWHIVVFHHFGNPIYPFAGSIFANGVAMPGDLSDHRFTPEHWYDAIWYPLKMAIGTRPILNSPHFIGAELRFRDIRYLSGLIGALGLIVLALVDRSKGRDRHTALLQLSVFYIFTYAVWIGVFGITRYAIVLELLGGGLMLALIARIAPSKAALPILMIAAALMVLSTRPGIWGRMPFAEDWFGHTAAEHMLPATYVLSADAPLAYVSILVPPASRVIRVGGPLPLDPNRGIGTRVHAIIMNSQTLMSVHDGSAPDDEAALWRFGLVKTSACTVIHVRISPLHVCRLARVQNALIKTKR